jgi:hypothetical protein
VPLEGGISHSAGTMPPGAFLQMNREKASENAQQQIMPQGLEVAEYTAWACEFLMFLFCRVHVHVR